MEIVHLSPHSRHYHKGTASKYGTNTQADFEKLVQDGLKVTQSEGYIGGPGFEKPTPESINVDPMQAENLDTSSETDIHDQAEKTADETGDDVFKGEK